MTASTAIAPLEFKERLLSLASNHKASFHPLFDELKRVTLTPHKVAGLLKNYDAHACVLRRLLLLAASIMPEPAVGFVLENVRNEYGNGNYDDNHQGQLKDVAHKAGVTNQMWQATPIEPGVKLFIKQAVRYYHPIGKQISGIPQAVSAGAITATELLAIKEFQAMQEAFCRLGLSSHLWFDHVSIEEEHGDESLMLALHFAKKTAAFPDVEKGMRGILDANLHLYDGLLASLRTGDSLGHK